MVLYESGSVTHGRPFSLKGRFYANLFIHFHPTGEYLDGGWQPLNDFLPPYIIPNSPVQEHWIRQNPSGWKKDWPSAAAVGKLPGHAAADEGDVAALEELAAENERALHVRDENGWQPLHEAVRNGHIDAVRLLVEHGADINAVTNGEYGVSPYNIAIDLLPPNHPVTKFLESLGALNIGPDSSEL